MADLTWKALDEWLQAQWLAANPPLIDYSGTITDGDNRGSYDAGRWNSRWYDEGGFTHDEIGGVKLPGQDGLWTFNSTAQGQYFTQQIGDYNSHDYKIAKAGADGKVEFGKTTFQGSSGNFWSDVFGQSGLTGFVKDVLPIAAWVATPFAIGAGAEALGVGAAGDAAAGAGWVSAEGGTGYAGGLAADGVIDGAITYSVPQQAVEVGKLNLDGTAVAKSGSIWEAAGKFALDQAGKVATAAATSAATKAITPNPNPLQGNPLPIDTPGAVPTAVPIDSRKQTMLALLAGAVALAVFH